MLVTQLKKPSTGSHKLVNSHTLLSTEHQSLLSNIITAITNINHHQYHISKRDHH